MINSLKVCTLFVIALLIGACATQPQSIASPASQVATTATPASIAVATSIATPSAEPPSGTPIPPTSSAPEGPSGTPPATSTATPSPILPTSTAMATSTPTTEPSPTAEPSPTLDPATPLEGAELVDALRRGGYVIYFRHAATDRTQADTDTQNLENCEMQRNLNDQGRADASAIGEAFQTLGIPVGQVLSSGYCRARDTAQLAFGRAEITPDLTGFPSALREQRIAALRQMLSTPPQPGMNTVLVAHGFNITNTADISIAEGEAAIFAPQRPEGSRSPEGPKGKGLGPDGFALIARVRPEQWAELVN